MEILAPAGNLEQATAAISAGCNALYGGLKKYSARKRAANFTVEEYNNLLKLCHANNVKLYLTLNTLMKTAEIEEVKALFASSDFTYPDAVIIADIGLVKMFRDNFPEVKLHASTQFGACTVEDLKFLENLGFERAVLAREMTFTELKKLKEQTEIELEVFGYGSQCIAFSGQCLWGGMLNNTSGNRGACIGMCRDTYSCNGLKGQLMYPQDINCHALIDELDALGIASYKIEGRLRKPAEVYSVVKDCLQPDTAKNNEYVGYLGDIIPVPSMLNLVNPRHKFNSEKEKIQAEFVEAGKIEDLVQGLSKDMVYETDKADDIKILKANGKNNIVFALTNAAELDKALDLDNDDSCIIYKLPLLDFKNRLPDMLTKLKGKRIMISKLSQLNMTKPYEVKVVGAEYTVNVWNKYAAEMLAEYGISRFVMHPEHLLQEGQLTCTTEQVVLGRIPLGFSRACWGEVGACHKLCGRDTFSLHNEDKDYDLTVYCNNEFGSRTVCANAINTFQPEQNADCYRIILSGMPEQQKLAIITGKEFSGFEMLENNGDVA